MIFASKLTITQYFVLSKLFIYPLRKRILYFTGTVFSKISISCLNFDPSDYLTDDTSRFIVYKSFSSKHNSEVSMFFLKSINLEKLSNKQIYEVISGKYSDVTELEIDFYESFVSVLSIRTPKIPVFTIVSYFIKMGDVERAKFYLTNYVPLTEEVKTWLTLLLDICKLSNCKDEIKELINLSCLYIDQADLIDIAIARQSVLIDLCCGELFGEHFILAAKNEFNASKFINLYDNPRFFTFFDLRHFPYSLGEIFYQMQAVECEIFHSKFSQVEVVIYAPSLSRPDQQTNIYNYFEKVLDLTRLLEYFSKVNSIKVFNEEKEYENYFSEISTKSGFLPKKNKSYRDNTSIINSFYKKHSFIPEMTIRRKLFDDVRRFIRSHAGERIPICLHIRANKVHRETERNANLSEMYSLCSMILNEFSNTHIFIISGISESSEIRKRFNFPKSRMTIVKEHNTSSSFDFAIATNCGIFLGGPSGPSVPVIYGTQPYVLFNYRIHTSFHFLDVSHEDGYIHSKENQMILWGKENAKDIFAAFEKVFLSFDRESYQQILNSKDSAKNTSNFHVLR